MTADPARFDAPDRATDRFLGDWLVDEDVPGASVAIVDRDGVIGAAGYGARDTDERLPATPETVYGLGSVSKPVTALVVLRLADRGALALDEPVADYLPVLADVPGEPVTVHDLLAHSSGLPRDFVTARENVVDDETLFRHVDGAVGQRLTDRDRYMYYNSGYLLLGELVAAVTDRPFATVARDTVLEPLGMDRSTFEPDELTEVDDVATGYREDDGSRSPVSLEAVEEGGAAGGLLTSTVDLTALVRFILNGGERDGERLLARDTFDAATTRQSAPLPTADGSTPGYGYGWEVDEFMGERLLEHRGSIYFSGGYVGVLPDRGLGVALALNANAAGRSVVSTGRGVLALAADESPTEQVRMLAVESKVDAVVGDYETRRGEARATVERAPVGRIAVETDGLGVRFHARPASEDPGDRTFVARMGDGTKWLAEFRGTGAGAELVLSTGKWTTRFERV